MISINKRQLEKIFTLLPLVIGSLILLLSTFVYTRIDMTDNKVYTISSVSKDLIQNLEDPVDITYYLSNRIRQEIPEIQTIVDLLEEMQRINPNLLRVRIYDPDDDPPQRPEDLGIQPQQYQVVESNQQSLTTVYTGLVITFRDNFLPIPVIIDPSTVEYEIIQVIRELISPEPKVIGVLFGDYSAEQNHQILMNTLGGYSEVRQIAPGQDIGSDVQALFVIGHKDLTKAHLFLIDQYLMQGRPALFAWDYHGVDLQGGLAPQEGAITPALELIREYGVTIEPQWVLDPQNQPIPVQQSQGRVVFSTKQAYPLWPRVGLSGADPEHPLTQRFSGLDLFWASPVNFESMVQPDLEVSFPLRATFQATAMNPPLQVDPSISVPGIPGPPGGYHLTMTLEGNLKSGFTEAIPPGYSSWPFIDQSIHPTRIVVIGDQDVFSDLVQINQSVYNLEFAQNIYQWLIGDEAMLGIRTRQIVNTPLDKIQDSQERQERARFARTWGILSGPLLFALIALFRYFQRKKYIRGLNND